VSNVYNVYAHARGQWGFTDTCDDGRVQTAFIDARDARVTLAAVDPIKVAPLLQRKLREGYQKVAQPKYLHLKPDPQGGGQTGMFVVQHPDLGLDFQGARIYFVAVPKGMQMHDVVHAWAQKLEACESEPTGIESWLHHCSGCTTYVPAFSDDVHAALLLAQWARQNNLVLVAQRPNVPDSTPEKQPYAWREYLAHWFTLNDIDRALDGLGWSLRDAITCGPAATEPTGPVSEGEWKALAQQAAF